jgi:twitching motility protein PilT
VSGQLDQILAYLDRPGVTEIVVGNGRAITFRRDDEDVGLTKEPLTKAQFATLIRGTALYHLVPDRDGKKPPAEITVGTRLLQITASRKGDEVSFRIAKAQPSLDLGGGSRARSTTKSSRTKSKDFTETTRAQRASKAAFDPRRDDDPPPRGKVSTKAPEPIGSGPLAGAAGGKKAQPFDGLDLGIGGDAGRAKKPTKAPSFHTVDMDLELGLEAPAAPPKPRTPPPPPLEALSVSIDLGDVQPPKKGKPAAKPVDLDLGLEMAMPAVRIETPPPRAAVVEGSFHALLERAVERGASDLHVSANRPISIRILGELAPLDAGGKPLSAAEADALLSPLLAPGQQQQLQQAGYVDLALEVPGNGGRLRANISKFQGGLKGTFRIARKEPPTLDELGLPKELGKLVQHHQGLVVIAGPSGHGKTTTLAALVDQINASRPFHIITVEDPIEIVYPRRAAVVSQREVGPHTRSFAAALKGSLREDPDVIVIGELRDRETVEIALTAAETGHLVIATMSTPSAAKTIDRLVDMFPPADQAQVRASIAGALRAIISQRLLPGAAGKRIHPAVEVLTGVLALSAMIRDDKLFQLPNLMQRGKAFGMIRFDDSLLELVKANKVTLDTALAAAENKKELAAAFGRSTASIPTVKGADPMKKSGPLGGIFGGRKDS